MHKWKWEFIINGHINWNQTAGTWAIIYYMHQKRLDVHTHNACVSIIPSYSNMQWYVHIMYRIYDYIAAIFSSNMQSWLHIQAMQICSIGLADSLHAVYTTYIILWSSHESLPSTFSLILTPGHIRIFAILWGYCNAVCIIVYKCSIPSFSSSATYCEFYVGVKQVYTQQELVWWHCLVSVVWTVWCV